MAFVENKIQNLLKDKEIDYQEYEHEPVYTCEVADKVRKRIEESNEDGSKKSGIKNLLFETRGGKFIIALGPGDMKINIEKISKLEGTKFMRLSKAKDLERIVGCPIGCVPPFGHKNRIKTYIDKELLESEYLYFNPGNHSKTMKIKAEDLLKLIEKPIIYE